MSKLRVTLADIALKAGVHVTTVSLAMRNSPRLPAKTRDRLQSLAKELGYAPDPLLRALVAYRGRVMPRKNALTLAYVTNWNTRWGWKKVTAHPLFHFGAVSKAKELGFQIDHFWLRESGLTHSRLSRILEARGINGIIVASHLREIDETLQFDWPRFSAVKIDYFPHRPELHNVTNDQCSIVRLAVRQAIAAGYRRIGFVMHRGWDHSVDGLWTAGFLCEQQHLAPEDQIPMHIFPDADPVEAWFSESKAELLPEPKTIAKWFNRYKPEVIISKESFIRPLFKQLDLRVPKDVAFVDVFLEDFSGKTAGVRQNHETVGELAVEILAGQLQHNKFGVPLIPTTTYVEGSWFAGATLPPRTARKEVEEAPSALPASSSL